MAGITEKQTRRGVHRSTGELETAIRACLNADPKPFRWTKSADDILAAVNRFCLNTLEIASVQTEIERNSESGHYCRPCILLSLLSSTRPSGSLKGRSSNCV
jgi:hypothetical protein